MVNNSSEEKEAIHETVKAGLEEIQRRSSILSSEENNNKYISPWMIDSLKNYKYKSGDNSIMSYYLQSYWEYCAKLVPKQIAPNTITVLGFLGILLGFGLLIINNPNLESNHVNGIFYFLNGILLFYYQTMDAIDGKHARNTKNSSPLGELVDHGLDALVGYFQIIVLMSGLNLNNSFYSLIVIIIYYITSFIMIWNAYVTDLLVFGKYDSPTEVILLAIGILFISSIFGQEIWSFKIFNFSFNHLAIIIGTILSISVIFNNIKLVLKYAHHSNSKRSYRAKFIVGGVLGSLKAAFPFLLTVLLFSLYCYFNYLFISNYFILNTLIYGLIGSYIQTRLILARVCNTTSPILYWIMLPLPILLLNGFYGLMNPLVLVFISNIYVIVCYVHFVYYAVNEICKALDIYCFKVKAPLIENVTNVNKLN
ncbi:hypothetical protein ABK040_016166 [Willaertia magna]